MKRIEIKDLGRLPGRRVSLDEPFSFGCHPSIGCYNRCCRNLNLFLYPYDVVCLKNRLGLDSAAFLDRYIDVVIREGSYFPDVLLRMADNDEKSCPFMAPAGCVVYADRPDTCRTFPFELGVFYEENRQKGETICFFKPPEFCLGPQEETLWTFRLWEKNQEARAHHRMTEIWSDLKLLFQTNPWAGPNLEDPKAKMAFMATYNIDKFRKFIFESSFLARYKVKSQLLSKIKNDDTELMLFGFSWVRLFVFGKKTPDIQPKKK